MTLLDDTMIKLPQRTPKTGGRVRIDQEDQYLSGSADPGDQQLSTGMTELAL